MAAKKKNKKKRNWYTNEVLDKVVNGNGVLMFIVLGIGAVSLLLCTLGIINILRGLDEGSYIPHVCFGVTGLVVTAAGLDVDHTFDVIKSYGPVCGDTRFTRAQVDEQANSPDSVYLDNIAAFLAPDMLIGASAGVAAVAYKDIHTLQIMKRWHTERRGPKRYSHATSNYKEYYTYKILVRTNKGKRVVISRTRCNPETALETIYNHCLEKNPEVKLLPMKKSMLAD